jgi:hypothetical protein
LGLVALLPVGSPVYLWVPCVPVRPRASCLGGVGSWVVRG